MIEKTPPTNPLHRHLWLMGFDEPQRKMIIRICAELNLDPIAYGRFLAAEQGTQLLNSMKQKQPWYIRLKFWLRRQWRRVAR